MSDDLVEIAGRVQRLERDNRRLKLAGGAMAAVLVAVPLVGAALPAQVPEVIEARAFRVLDENGTQRAGLGARWTGASPTSRGRNAYRPWPTHSDGLRFYTDEQGSLLVDPSLPAAWCSSTSTSWGRRDRAVFDAGALCFGR